MAQARWPSLLGGRPQFPFTGLIRGLHEYPHVMVWLPHSENSKKAEVPLSFMTWHLKSHTGASAEFCWLYSPSLTQCERGLHRGAGTKH